MTVRARSAFVAVVLAVSTATGLALSVSSPGNAQDWRGPALASFDEAWQTIHDTFYDPAFGGVDWDAVRTELRPKVEAAASPEAARVVIRAMLSQLHRSHFVLLSSDSATDALPGEATAAIDLRMSAPGLVVTSVWMGSSAAEAGLRPGDVIQQIDGQSITDWLRASTGADDRARNLEVWRRAYRALHGETGSHVKFVVQSPGGENRVVDVTRAREPGQVVKLGNLPPLHVTFETQGKTTASNHRVGVIAFNYWMATLNGPISAAVDQYRQDAGLVIDLRGNSGGLAEMISGVAGHLIAQPVLLGRMQMRNVELHFQVNPRLSTPDGRSVTPFSGPVAILVDELSASASECFAGALQSLGRARIFGRQSMGQALPASTKLLSNGDVLMYAIGDFVTATGRRLEGTGVLPDEAQPLSIAALAAGRDLTLEAAITWIDGTSK